MQIPSLSLPMGSETTLEAAIGSEAVQLFVSRARDVQPDFQVTEANAPALVEIARRLDGIPLALELAAARLRMLSAEQIAERLNDRFRLLTGGRRTALPRQQTLQALIDWSWNLLEEDERVLLRRLSVFSGGWTLEAAQAVAAGEDLDEYAVFDGLEQLINKSLVVVERKSGGQVRYRMLESIHQYARDRLFEAGEGEALRDRHAEYYVRFEETAGREMEGRNMLAWIDRVIDEADNAKAAREWALDMRFDLALKMVGTSQMVQRYLYVNVEGMRWLEQVVASGASRFRKRKVTWTTARGWPGPVIALGAVTTFQGENAKGAPVIGAGHRSARNRRGCSSSGFLA